MQLVISSIKNIFCMELERLHSGHLQMLSGYKLLFSLQPSKNENR